MRITKRTTAIISHTSMGVLFQLGLRTCKISRLSAKKNFDLSTYLRGDNSVDMVPTPLANGGSNSTISDQVILCHINFI